MAAVRGSVRVSMSVFALVILAACGSGTLPLPADAPTALQGDCFRLAPGLVFEMSDGSRWEGLAELFEGQPASGLARLRTDGSRRAAYFQHVHGGAVVFLGERAYDSTGAAGDTAVYSPGYRVPFGLAPGTSQAFVFTTALGEAGREIETTAMEITYLGRETVQFGAHRFDHACKLKVLQRTEADGNPDADASSGQLVWLAAGFGVVAREQLDEEASVLPGGRVQLTRIIAPP